MLKKGQIIKLSDGPARVISVNESRAHVKYLSGSDVKFKTHFGDKVQFHSGGKETDISPNSEAEIIKEVEVFNG